MTTTPASTTSPSTPADPRKSVQIAATVRRQIDDGTLQPGTPVSAPPPSRASTTSTGRPQPRDSASSSQKDASPSGFGYGY